MRSILSFTALSLALIALPSSSRAGDDAKTKKKKRSAKSLEKHYIGKHKLGVNRVNWGKRVGKSSITKVDGKLQLQGRLEKGQYYLEISGEVTPISKKEFVLDGRFFGVPNLNFRNEAPKEQTTEGKFVFRSTKNRRYWRLYEVNGQDCVCDDGCGNDFCYIDLSFR